MKNCENTRILLVDDHPLLLDGIKAWLETLGNLEIIGQVGSGEEAMEKVDQLDPDMVLVDISLPGVNGLEFARLLKEEKAGVKVVFLTVHNNREYVREALRLGACGYLLKNAPSDELAEAIKMVLQGRRYFSQEIHSQIIEGFITEEENPGPARLTPRQRQVLIQVTSGKTNKEIALHLNISHRTVETHRQAIKKRLDIHSEAELTKYALAQGLI